MARIQIELPEKFVFTAQIPVRITDLNYGNHLGNDALLSILHEARVQLLQHYGFTEKNVDGTGLIMSDVAIQYKAEAFYNDVIEIKMQVTDIGRVGFDIIYYLSVKDRVIAIAKTGMVCYDYTLRKIVKVPDLFIQQFSI